MFWLLSFFPDFIAHLLAVIGILLFIAATFLGIVPFISQYKLPGQLLGALMFAVGLYLEGGIAYKDEIAVKVAELQTKLAQAVVDGAKTNVQIVEKVVVQKQLIKTKGDTVIKYIETHKEAIDKACVIPQDVIDAHNKAATLQGIDEAIQPNAGYKLPSRTDKK